MTTRFLIGRGELLAGEIPPPKRKMEKAHPYSYGEAVQILKPQVTAATLALDNLPAAACPSDVAVSKITLHPAYIAKSFFPADLLRISGLQSVGSRTVRVQPRKSATKEKGPADTTQLFVAGSRAAFRSFRDGLASFSPSSKEAEDLAKIEDFAAATRNDRLKVSSNQRANVFEVGLYLPDQHIDVVTSFRRFARSLQFHVDPRFQFQYGGLVFVAVEGPREPLKNSAKYDYIESAQIDNDRTWIS